MIPAFARSSIAERLSAHLKTRTGTGSAAMALGAQLRARLEEQQILFAGGLLPSFPTPHLVDRRVERMWGAMVEQVTDILEILGRRLLVDRGLRDRLALPPGSDELLEIEPGYARMGVVERFDMVWEGHRIRLLEANADSPAMMTYTDRLERMFLEMEPFNVLSTFGAEPQNRSAAMLQAILGCYREWGGSSETPTIAIVDWAFEATANELKHTAADFNELGCPTFVCDPRELHMVNGRLQHGGRTIDIVQRRVLFPDFLKRRRDLLPLLEAYRTGKVCMVNPLRSFLIGNKATMAFAWQHPGEFELNGAAREVFRELVPESRIVDGTFADRLIAEREHWVLKGALGSGGKQVCLGCFSDGDDWGEAVRGACRELSIGQRLLPIPTLDMPCGENGESQALYANWNPWVFGGSYTGGMTRVGRRPIVGITGGGGLLPVFSLSDAAELDSTFEW